MPTAAPARTPAPTPALACTDEGEYSLETVVYKEVSDIKIHADVYVPRAGRQTSPLAIAMMIHGGAFMMYSRKHIRPAQTKYLLSNGFLPVSVDYRLCPEVNIIDGPMADVKDAYAWARTELSSYISTKYGIAVDCSRVVAVGWSTGGHLAMSLGWTTRSVNIPPPSGILSFYAPIDFMSSDLDTHAGKSLPMPRQNIATILQKLGRAPITTYNPHNSTEDEGFYGLFPGDPRSDLILSVAERGTALPLLLNNIDEPNFLAAPSAARIAAISPLAQLYLGNYATPTFIIHSRQDKVCPFAAAERFINELKARGVKAGLLALQAAPHLHDLYTRPGMREWDEQVKPGYAFLNQVMSSA
ncbi:Alpha/Beta hydrolase protein [Aspergillus similis]